MLCPLRWHALSVAGQNRRWHLRAYAESELIGLASPAHIGADVWRMHRLRGTGMTRPCALAEVGLDRLVGAIGLTVFVVVSGATAARECLDAGLLDQIMVSLVPVILGEGVPWFAGARRPDVPRRKRAAAPCPPESAPEPDPAQVVRRQRPEEAGDQPEHDAGQSFRNQHLDDDLQGTCAESAGCFDETLIDPAYPDYDEMRRIVQEAIDPAPAAEETPETSPAPTSAAPTPTSTPHTCARPASPSTGQRLAIVARGCFAVTSTTARSS